MQTIYTTSNRLGIRVNNIIDLNEYRRQLGQAVEDPEADIEVEPLLWATQQEEDRPVHRTRRAAHASAWALDIMASAGVLAMTVAFTIQIL